MQVAKMIQIHFWTFWLCSLVLVSGRPIISCDPEPTPDDPPLTILIPVPAQIYDEARQKADMIALIIQDIGLDDPALIDATCKSLIISEKRITSARILTINSTTGTVLTASTWKRSPGSTSLLEIIGPIKATNENPLPGLVPGRAFYWYEDAAAGPGLSKKFMSSPPNVSFKGWWTYPYYSCFFRKWLISYSIPILLTGKTTRGFLSLDVDISNLVVNQCESSEGSNNEKSTEIPAFHGTHKCPKNSMCKNLGRPGLMRGNYECICKPGYYSPIGAYNGSMIETAYEEKKLNGSNTYDDFVVCLKCADGCAECKDSSPCLAEYDWFLRAILLSASMTCALITLIIMVLVYYNRKNKDFTLASPAFLLYTLLACFVMYLETASTFPVLDVHFCSATKWVRHVGFWILYLALMMKILKVYLKYRVKTAYKVKLPEQYLLQWVIPISAVLVVYIGAWTISDPPIGKVVKGLNGLEFKECSYNWWDYCISIGEVIFLIRGLRISCSVRRAKSYCNEARMISFAVYNFAVVNIAMIVFETFSPHIGPDFKYLMDFVRTQLNTTVTILLVFFPRIRRLWQEQNDREITEGDDSDTTDDESPDEPVAISGPAAKGLVRENNLLRGLLLKILTKLRSWTIGAMMSKNPHLKPRPDGPFTIKHLVDTTIELLETNDLESIDRLLNKPNAFDSNEEDPEEGIELQDMQTQTEPHQSTFSSAPASSHQQSV